ncbi:hypothetical protein WH367_07315 [Comamonas sp. MYb21]
MSIRIQLIYDECIFKTQCSSLRKVDAGQVNSGALSAFRFHPVGFDSHRTGGDTGAWLLQTSNHSPVSLTRLQQRQGRMAHGQTM